MDFAFTAEDNAFRAELREFLAAEVPPNYQGHYNSSDEDFQTSLKVAGKMGERGWLTMHWPREYGGQDASIWQQLVMREEMVANHEPRGSQYMSANWIGPSILLFGSEEQKKEHLGRIAAGRALWAQGFSEPDAGSDLASLKTRAVRDGDEYVVNGEKIWTSHTPRAEWLFLLVRTDPEAPKHRGISVLLLPIDTPGIEIRPLLTMDNHGPNKAHGGEFANVIFHDVRVPVSARLGPENEGWQVTIAALNFERLGNPRFYGSVTRLEQLRDYAKQTPDDRYGTLWDDPLVRQRWSQLRTDAEAARWLFYWSSSQLAADEDATLALSASRIAGTTSNQNVGRFAAELMGDAFDLEDADTWVPFDGTVPSEWEHSITATIAAGTLEINKNTLATRGLGLPR